MAFLRKEKLSNNLGKMLKQKRVMIPLTLQELAAKSGVTASHLGRIERGERFPSGRILHRIAEPLGFDEAQLLTLAGYLPSSEGESETPIRRVDPYVASVLASEPVEVQRTVIAILTILKSMARGGQCDIEFAEYARRKFPELDDDVITMIEDLIEHERQEKR